MSCFLFQYIFTCNCDAITPVFSVSWSFRNQYADLVPQKLEKCNASWLSKSINFFKNKWYVSYLDGINSKACLFQTERVIHFILSNCHVSAIPTANPGE